MLDSLRNRQTAFVAFVGAGASKIAPSLLPTWKEITRQQAEVRLGGQDQVVDVGTGFELELLKTCSPRDVEQILEDQLILEDAVVSRLEEGGVRDPFGPSRAGRGRPAGRRLPGGSAI